ncbi:efflux RND transporter periplasmic adaptor subunit [Riemerella anatipestifer]|uniref:efflux RND transporter periplasmic adaptor subunit n=1 Tax=Riemerella anatipestifer TaxID=34085 RepID=UPI00066C888F|nr:efflux RND transporter periplasmic adaptor subunit [Riemerella anatipestifer]AKP69386.1 efflux transporter, rnd family, mfp subunit [Riemerella anatipestifer]MCW0478835.1 efflux RND transporter periplasmic adaptor subunit [Riemerella anatipestifer]MCW0497260.1 efflux RND transporter periplasmic adaptor subunit [Riemerella anatipestifer]QOZ87688.1 efflux RND transporter periplasmic adaptor subunit [Riemerella anatipestifer]
MNKKTLLSIIAVVGVAVGFFFILQKNKANNQEQVNIVAEKNNEIAVKAEAVKREEIGGAFSVNGTFLPKTQANISAEMGGQLVALYVKEGSYVRAGQVIAKLKGDKINVNVSNAQANLDQAISALNRFEAAYKTGGVTALQLDQARLQVKNARAQVQSAQLMSGDTNVVSKVSGIVNQKMVELGSVVGAGTPIVQVVDISSLKLKVEVDESQVTQLAVGNTVKVKPSVVDAEIDGQVSFIAPASNGALKFPVEITINNASNILKAGMYGTATFDRTGAKEILSIPRNAFVGGVSDNLVFVVRNGVAHLTKIQSGANYGDKVEVTGGLNAGDMVVTSGQINLADGAKVKVLK